MSGDVSLHPVQDSATGLIDLETAASLSMLQKAMLIAISGVEQLQHVVLYQPRRA
jgi:hypothetical protein